MALLQSDDFVGHIPVPDLVTVKPSQILQYLNEEAQPSNGWDFYHNSHHTTSSLSSMAVPLSTNTTSLDPDSVLGALQLLCGDEAVAYFHANMTPIDQVVVQGLRALTESYGVLLVVFMLTTFTKRCLLHSLRNDKRTVAGTGTGTGIGTGASTLSVQGGSIKTMLSHGKRCCRRCFSSARSLTRCLSPWLFICLLLYSAVVSGVLLVQTFEQLYNMTSDLNFSTTCNFVFVGFFGQYKFTTSLLLLTHFHITDVLLFVSSGVTFAALCVSSCCYSCCVPCACYCYHGCTDLEKGDPYAGSCEVLIGLVLIVSTPLLLIYFLIALAPYAAVVSFAGVVYASIMYLLTMCVKWICGSSIPNWKQFYSISLNLDSNTMTERHDIVMEAESDNTDSARLSSVTMNTEYMVLEEVEIEDDTHDSQKLVVIEPMGAGTDTDTDTESDPKHHDYGSMMQQNLVTLSSDPGPGPGPTHANIIDHDSNSKCNSRFIDAITQFQQQVGRLPPKLVLAAMPLIMVLLLFVMYITSIFAIATAALINGQPDLRLDVIVGHQWIGIARGINHFLHYLYVESWTDLPHILTIFSASISTLFNRIVSFSAFKKTVLLLRFAGLLGMGMLPHFDDHHHP
jgi:hypothetical protein